MSADPARQTPRYERKREAVLDAAAELFNARGLGGTTIADVAQAVGLNTASVTYYYRRKEDLAAACLMRAIETMNAMVDATEGERSPAARLTRFLQVYFQRLADTVEGRATAMINFWDLRALTGPHAGAATQAFVALFRRFRELFRDPGGPVFSRAEQNARAHLVFSAAIAAKGWTDRYEPEDYPRAAARMADILVLGMAGPGRVWAPLRLELATRRETEPGEVSREDFLRAATELVNEFGYRGASVDRISARLNVTKGSFYHHNETKDELVAACFAHTFETIRRAHRRAIDAAPDGWGRLCALSAALVRHQHGEHGPLLRLSALSAAATTMRPRLLTELDRLSEKTAGLVADGVADGSVRAIDPEIAALILAGLINAAAELSKWAQAANAQTAAELFCKPLMTGVFAPGDYGRP